MKLSRKILLFINAGLATSLFLAYYAPHVDPNKIWYFSFFGLMYPVLFLLNLVLIIYWCFIDLKFTLISIISIALGWNVISNYFAFNTDKISSNPYDISVISFNIGNALEAYDTHSKLKESKQSKMAKFLERFKDEDIICLQEVGAYASDIINKNFPSYNIHKFDKGTVILSKHKIIKKGQIEFGTKTNSCLWADLVINLDTIRVYSLHLQSNKISKDADRVTHGDLNDEETWEGIRGIFRKYRYHHKARAIQARTVKEHTRISPYPVLICGDLNDVPLSYTYALLQENLVDAFKSKGNGLGSTFNGNIPFLRIDYIFSDPELIINKFNVIKENYSDHYPVAALLSLRKV